MHSADAIAFVSFLKLIFLLYSSITLPFCHTLQIQSHLTSFNTPHVIPFPRFGLHRNMPLTLFSYSYVFLPLLPWHWEGNKNNSTHRLFTGHYNNWGIFITGHLGNTWHCHCEIDIMFRESYDTYSKGSQIILKGILCVMPRNMAKLHTNNSFIHRLFCIN